MAPWDDFDTIFYFNRNFVYDGKAIEQIISNRRALENQLFADRLLGLLGVRAGQSIPPIAVGVRRVTDLSRYSHEAVSPSI